MESDKIRSFLELSHVRGFAKASSVHMIVKLNTKLKNLMDFITKKLNDDNFEEVGLTHSRGLYPWLISIDNRSFAGAFRAPLVRLWPWRNT